LLREEGLWAAEGVGHLSSNLSIKLFLIKIFHVIELSAMYHPKSFLSSAAFFSSICKSCITATRDFEASGSSPRLRARDVQSSLHRASPSFELKLSLNL
jgi:hypothetical protein